MLITALVPGKKSLCAMYIDGEYAVSLDAAVLAEEGVKAGSELNDEQLYELIKKSDLHRAKEKALHLLSDRDHTRRELIEKLKRSVSQEAAEHTADRMEELGLLDDEKFAAHYARQLLLNKGLSQRAAEYKMLQKGLERDLCRRALEAVEADPQRQIINLLEKKYSKQLTDDNGMKKVFAALQRRGYSYCDIRDAVAQFTEDWIE